MDSPLSSGGRGARPLPGVGSRGPIGLLLAGLLLTGAGASSCTAPRSSEAPPGHSSLSLRGTPRWVGKPLTWGKLEEIERWLAESGTLAEPYWRLEGELELAEGRLMFARADIGQGAAAAGLLETRLASAREGFRRVAGDPEARPSQRRRALRHLEEGGLGDGHLAEPGLGQPSPGEAAAGARLSRAAWGARPPLPGRLDPVGGPWRRITVHHSDEVPGVTLDGSLPQSRTALQKIQRYHQENHGWGDIGYHYLIDPEGRIFEGRPVSWQGAHAGGANNVQNLGICMLGNFHHRLPSAPALASLERLLDEICRTHGVPRRQIHGHRDYKDTICPGDRLSAWLEAYSGTPRSVPRAASHAPRARQRAPLAGGPAPAIVH